MHKRVYQAPIRDKHELQKWLVETRAEFQYSVVDDAISQWHERLEACIHADGGHFEHLLRRCFPSIQGATQQNMLLLQPPGPPNTTRLFRVTKVWRETI